MEAVLEVIYYHESAWELHHPQPSFKIISYSCSTHNWAIHISLVKDNREPLATNAVFWPLFCCSISEGIIICLPTEFHTQVFLFEKEVTNLHADTQTETQALLLFDLDVIT